VECGELVVVDGDQVLDVAGGAHLCRDYVAWHRPPDRRHPSDLDVAGGWRPRVAGLARAA
jgi:hypothetical protein